MLRRILTGAMAGAAGTTALNAVTYLDMVVRARGTSSTPEDTVEAAAKRVGVDVPGEGEERDNRIAGMGPLLGLATGVLVGAGYGATTGVVGRPTPWTGSLLVGAAAMAGANAPMAALGVSDPRTWDSNAWLSDAIPHVAYGLVTAWAFEAAQPD